MKHLAYLAPSSEVTLLEPRDAVLTTTSNEAYTVVHSNPFGAPSSVYDDDDEDF